MILFKRNPAGISYGVQEAFALFNQRQLEIIDLLQTEDKVSVSELTQRFGVSLVTVRQDLKKLEDQGVLKRTHGGAIPVDNGYDTSTRMWNNYEQKLRIAQRAAEMLGETDSIIVASGSTVYAFAEEIKMRQWHHLNIVTPFLRLGVLLNEAENVNVVQLGGTVHKKSLSVLGEEASRSLDDCIC